MTGTSPLPGGDRTIVAIATAPGRGALATIRVSGPDSAAVAERIGAGGLVPRVVTRVTLTHPETGLRLDDALAVRFEAPASFTGEDGLELFTHGGARVPASVLAA
jgi:tRNA modification GTPase